MATPIPTATPDGEAPPGGYPASLSCEKIPLMDKGKILFFAMGGGENGFVTNAGFGSSLTRLGLHFTIERADTLFFKIHRTGERQPEGCSYADIMRMSTLYPTLFNVLTCRVIDYNMNARQLGIINDEEAALAGLRERSDDFTAKKDVVQADVSSKECALKECDDRLAALESDIMFKRDGLQIAHKKTIANKQALSNALLKLSEKQQEERQELVRVGVEGQRDVIQRGKTELERVKQDRDDTEAAIELLEKQLTSLKEVLWLKRKEVFAKEDEVAEQERALHDVLNGLSIQSELKDASAAAEQAKEDLETVQDVESDLATQLKASLQALNDSKVERERLGREVAEQKTVLEGEVYTAVAGENVYMVQKAKVDELKAANQKFNDLRDRQYLEETDLVEEEIRLRDQREKLEFQEQLLRNEVNRVTPQFEPRTHRAGYSVSPGRAESFSAAPTPTQRALNYPAPAAAPQQPPSSVATPASVPSKPDSIPRAKQTDSRSTTHGASPEP
eukprot:TRINITY_DN29807_c0_g1_i1.p1 TRINITY_DN29807_c0_g1~~TRINITY_DN29807_c0_g1_i1.p1  ORF type:complete len:526 (+),score=230.99 TRINITY_DN29807_c0_g1_i1:64-1578(+)